ncbi:MAG: VOC family protein [Gemmatimonadaceae bacterium]
MTDHSSNPEHARKRAEPVSFRARSLSISLTVKDLQKSLVWYRDVVGFTLELLHEHEGKARSASIKAGDVQIRLNQDDGAKGWTRVKGEGISFYLATVQDVDSIATRIKERGGTLQSEPADMPWGARVFRLRDPDGFNFTISSIRAGS